MKLNNLKITSAVAIAAALSLIGANAVQAVTCSVPSGAYATIQSAVDDPTCNTIDVAPGTYPENVVINRQLTLSGAGNTTIIHPTAPGPGISLSTGGTSTGSRMVIEKLQVTGALGGGNIGSGISIVGSGSFGFITFDEITSTGNSGNGLCVNGSMALNDVVISETNLTNNVTDGFRVPTSMVSLDGLQISTCHLDGNGFAGWEAYTNQAAGPLKNVMVSATTFNNNPGKGIYIERLSNAQFTNIEVNQSGTTGGFAAGIDLNLKYASFQDITVQDSTIANCGTGDVTNGVGLTVKARSDAPSYSTQPATLSNVTITNNEITANQSGLRFGEPSKNNAGPTGVSVHNNNITGNVVLGINNQTVPMVNATCNWWGAPNGPGPVGPGSGDRVSDNVNYSPWLTSPAPGGACGGMIVTTKGQCKNDGWRSLFRADGTSFENQGDCIQYVNTGK
jgi:hypothetical protein